MCIPLLTGSRTELIIRAQLWRALMSLGMNVGKIARPRPRSPSFRKRIKTTVSPQPGEIDLLFYTPTGYELPGGTQKAVVADDKAVAEDEKPVARGYPVVVNFHGGGFTLGRATDDARWSDAVVRNVNAVVVSVEYRLAPEHPFPTAVEDGVDAILYLLANSGELGIDPQRIATSGFSAGGNMAFTVPLKLQEVINAPPPDPNPNSDPELEPKKEQDGSDSTGETSSSQQPDTEPEREQDGADSAAVPSSPPQPDTEPEREQDGADSAVVPSSPKPKQPNSAKPNPIAAIAAWYPVTDFATHIRPKRKPSSARPDKDLPRFFTDLFDASYIQGSEVSLSSPYLSPGLAPVEMLRSLPENIIIYTCEWDTLLLEAEQMRDRLANEAGKKVVYRKVVGVAHAWDKSINPLKWDPSIEKVYGEACAALKKAFDIDGR